jgi:hypothetical protein
LSVSPLMLRQALPSAPQMSHWNWKRIGAEPSHVPAFADSLFPTAAVPLIVGGELLLGATTVLVPAASAPAAATRLAITAAASQRRAINFI